MKTDQKTNWLIGAALFAGFLVALWLDLTGLGLHQWLGIAVGALAIYHLAAHWRWVTAVTQRFFGRTSRQARTFYAVDAALAAGFVAVIGTGLVISTWLDLAPASYFTWVTVHVLASVSTLLLVVVKVGLHWRWIVTTARRHILPTQSTRPLSPIRAAAPAPTLSVAGQSRREFLRLMGGVGVVAVITGGNAIGNLLGQLGADEGALAALTDGVTPTPTKTPQSTATATATATPPATATSTTGTATATTTPTSTTGTATATATPTATTTAVPAVACTVRCNRGCSYPGHCRRYTDSNSNGKCDLGECV